MDSCVRLEAVRKTFGGVMAVDDLDLAIPRGETCGFVGPSGAGKTTTIRLILSILFPDAGRISVLGRNSALEAKDRIGYLPEERGVYRRMRVEAFLLYIAELKGIAPDAARARSRALMEALGLGQVGDRRCEELSKGMLQRVQFIATVVHDPDLLILDEPFSGLDPVSVRLLRNVITEQRQRGTTVLFSTHVMAHAEELCDRVIMIHRGRTVLDERTSALRRRFDPSRVLFEPLSPDADLGALADVPGVLACHRVDGSCEMRLAPGADPAEVIRGAVARVAPARVELARVRLEDMFVRLVGATASDDEAHQLRRELQGHSAEGHAA